MSQQCALVVTEASTYWAAFTKMMSLGNVQGAGGGKYWSLPRAGGKWQRRQRQTHLRGAEQEGN